MKHASKVDMTFKYKKAVETNLEETFKRIRRELTARASQRTVVQIRRKEK